MISQHIAMKMLGEVSQCMDNEHYIIYFSLDKFIMLVLISSIGN
jgi:hypothetical protein